MYVVPDFKRNNQCPFPHHNCVCLSVGKIKKGVTFVAVWVAMVMLAAGQDRTCQGGGEDGQTGAQTHTYTTHTHLWQRYQARKLLCLWQRWHGQTESAGGRLLSALVLRLKVLLKMSMLKHQINLLLTCCSPVRHLRSFLFSVYALILSWHE